MQELFDEGKFLCQFPLWMWIHPTAMSKGFIEINGAAGEKGFPLFTDKDLADRFVAEHPPLAHYAMGIAEDKEAFIPLLDMLERKGIIYVAIDPTKFRARFFPIAQVRTELQRQFPGDAADSAATD